MHSFRRMTSFVLGNFNLPKCKAQCVFKVGVMLNATLLFDIPNECISLLSYFIPVPSSTLHRATTQAYRMNSLKVKQIIFATTKNSLKSYQWTCNITFYCSFILTNLYSHKTINHS